MVMALIGNPDKPAAVIPTDVLRISRSVSDGCASGLVCTSAVMSHGSTQIRTLFSPMTSTMARDKSTLSP